jgi:MFS family permease
MQESVQLTPLQKKAWLLSAGGVALDGFDLFIMGVALPLLLDQFHGYPAWVTGLIASAAVVGAILGALFGGLLTDHFGRKRLYTWDLLGFIVFAVLSAFSWSVWALIFFRFMLGLAVGADYPIAASFSAEYLPSQVRGRWLVAGFSFQAIGMLMGALVGVALLELHPVDDTWRLMLAIGAVPALAIMWARRSVPETPVWREREAAPDKEPSARLSELFTRVHLRKTTLCAGAWFLMDVMMYGIGLFTPMLLASMKFADHSGWDFIQKDVGDTMGTAVLDLLLVVGFVIAILLVDRTGRLPLQKAGFLGCSVGLIILGLASTIDPENPPIALVIVGFALFNLMINAGPNSTTFLIPAEVYPTRLRATGHGFAASMGKAGAALGVFVLPILEDTWGTAVMVFVMAGIGLLGLALTQAFGVETRGADITASTAEGFPTGLAVEPPIGPA